MTETIGQTLFLAYEQRRKKEKIQSEKLKLSDGLSLSDDYLARLYFIRNRLVLVEINIALDRDERQKLADYYNDETQNPGVITLFSSGILERTYFDPEFVAALIDQSPGNGRWSGLMKSLPSTTERDKHKEKWSVKPSESQPVVIQEEDKYQKIITTKLIEYLVRNINFKQLSSVSTIKDIFSSLETFFQRHGVSQDHLGSTHYLLGRGSKRMSSY
jgi:hypothetical protein